MEMTRKNKIIITPNFDDSSFTEVALDNRPYTVKFDTLCWSRIECSFRLYDGLFFNLYLFLNILMLYKLELSIL